MLPSLAVALVESSPDAALVVDSAGHYREANATACRLLGYSRDELLDLHVSDLIPPGKIWSEILTAYRTEGMWRGELDIQRKNGAFIPVDAWSVAIPDPGGKVYASFLRNLGAHRQAEEDLSATQQHAMQVDLDAAEAGLRSKTRFLATMSHELRTPLQTVIGYADLLMSETSQPLTADQREDVATIQRAATHMATLIDDLLTLSQTTEDVTAVLAPEELRRVVDQVRQEMAPRAGARYLALDVNLPNWLPDVRADLMRLHRILRNLVENAIKFTDVGKVTISADVTDTELELTVHDTGLGIAADALPRIFEPFYQGESAVTRRYEGTGLGLSIARRFAEQMGGRITVKSNPGMGSAFTLHLAIVTPTSEDDATPHSHRRVASVGSQR